MDNGLVRRRPRGAETGEFGVYAVAFQNIGDRYRLAVLLVGHRALDDGPVDATDEIVLYFVDQILETAIDDRFERVEAGLRFLPRRGSVSSLPSIVAAWWALAAPTAVRGAPAIARRSSRGWLFIAAPVKRPPASRAPVRHGSVPRRSRRSAFGSRRSEGFVRFGCTRLRRARRPPAAASAAARPTLGRRRGRQ